MSTSLKGVLAASIKFSVDIPDFINPDLAANYLKKAEGMIAMAIAPILQKQLEGYGVKAKLTDARVTITPDSLTPGD